MKPFLLIIMIFSFATGLFAQQKKTIDFIGGARSYMSNSAINVQDSLPDTTTLKRNTGGYALIDMGVNIRPNDKTEIMGMFRIRNEYGGFWGAGVSFDVRQLWLKGIIGNVLRYQLGDLNLKQTPFTLYNNRVQLMDSLPSIFQLQQNIVNYEKFYTNNTWRQQGANVDFGLTFNKYIESIDVNAYLTRLRATDFSSVPDRLLGGFSLAIKQNNKLSYGLHKVSTFDLKGTILDSNVYTNNVTTLYAENKFYYKHNLGILKIELGNSVAKYSKDALAPVLKDYFIHAQAQFVAPANKWVASIAYLNVGPDFRSVGAQSMNVNFNASPNFYTSYANNKLSRPLSIMDLVRNEQIYTTGVSSNLMKPSLMYNAILPFGLATFNRVGVYTKASYQGIKGMDLNASVYKLSEIRGQGTTQLKQFLQAELQTTFQLHQLIGFKKGLLLQTGCRLQQTKRTGAIAVEQVDLKSLAWQVGINYEFAPKLQLIGGMIFFNAKGNDFVADRNLYTTVDYFTNQKMDVAQHMTALGLKCNFSAKSYITALYQSASNQDKLLVMPDYTMKQFLLIYNMTF